MYCPYCKAENFKLATACSSCGKSLSSIRMPSEFRCTECGSDVSADALFCWNCGGQLEPKIDTTGTEKKSSQLTSRSLKANKKIVEESVCKSCSKNFNIGDDIIICDNCHSYYHQACWEKTGSCTQPTCAEETKFCTFCGKQIKKSAVKCRYCGNYLDPTIAQNKFVNKGVLKDANTALTYAIIGIFCFGIILGPMAISKGNEAKRIIDTQPGYEGRGKAQAAVVIGWIEIVLWVIGILMRISNA